MNLYVDPRMYSNQSSKLESAVANGDTRLKESCQAFEAVMLQTMFKAMHGAESEDGLFEKDMASEVYRDLFDGEVALEMAHSQSLGIGYQVYSQLQQQSK
ncbi:MAG: rod-binding protein [Desulfuromonas sp.]|nr:rod-binding protein [Desulfuromonas sp.]